MEQKRQEEAKGIAKLLTYMKPDGRTAAVAVSMGTLTVFVILAVICPAWYEALPAYTEFITGVTTFSGYNKEADMLIVKVLLLSIPVLALLFAALLQYLFRRVQMGEHVFLTFLGGYFLYLVQLMNGGSCKAWGVWLLLLLVGYCILYDGRTYDGEEWMSFLTVSLLAYVALQSVSMGLLRFLPSAQGQGNGSSLLFLLPSVMAGGLYLWYACAIRRGHVKGGFVTALGQMLIPAGLIGMDCFRYDYEGTGEVFGLFYSLRYRLCLYVLVLLFVGIAIYGFIRRPGRILPTTVMAVAMLRVFTKPEGILNIDFFHMGEMTAPFMQLEAYGRRPLFDLMPIHGLCDYYYSLVDKLFLDDTYLSVNAAVTIGNLLLAAVLSMVVYVVCERKEWALIFTYCFMPFMINGAGIRYIFLFVSFFVLMSKRVRKSGLLYLWWYVVLSIISIAYNMSIGGAGAAAFFVPAILVYCPKAVSECIGLIRQKERKKLRILCGLYAAALCMGIAFIPPFLKIVEYLRENAGTTLMANGMAMIEDVSAYKEYLRPGFFGGETASFLQVFGFLIPLLICLTALFSHKSRTIRQTGREFFAVYFVCSCIIANYAFVRFDNALRTGVLGILFILALLLPVLGDGGKSEGRGRLFAAWLFLFLLTVSLTGDPVSLNLKELVQNKSVPGNAKTTIMGRTVDDPIVYVTGDSVGMNRLGNGFIRGNTLQNLQNLKYVYDTELGGEKEYLDLTNAIANYVFLDARMGLPYTSGYNISNEQMQKKAIELLEKNQPKLVILAPYIRFDEATISLRCPLLYEYFCDAGYEPYVYQNVIYLKREGSRLFDESNGFEDYANLMHKNALQLLPAVWGSSEAVGRLKPVVSDVKLHYGTEGLVCRLDGSVDGNAIDFIQITLPPEEETANGDEDSASGMQKEALEDAEGETLALVFGKQGEEHSFSFAVKGDRLLVPVYSSPYWKSLERADGFMLKMEEEGGALPERLKDATITCYQWGNLD